LRLGAQAGPRRNNKQQRQQAKPNEADNVASRAQTSLAGEKP
jgi:hypothetical protein